MSVQAIKSEPSGAWTSCGKPLALDEDDVVSVTLDLVQRVEANLIMRNYRGFLGAEGPIKGARA